MSGRTVKRSCATPSWLAHSDRNSEVNTGQLSRRACLKPKCCEFMTRKNLPRSESRSSAFSSILRSVPLQIAGPAPDRQDPLSTIQQAAFDNRVHVRFDVVKATPRALKHPPVI